ncbi:MAG: lmo0937 family membrane protein [Acidobacteria bacterium]|nr:lmo0937 family membrane protein [Acidobacteriota bacterium]
MIWTIIMILLVMWLVGVVTTHTFGGFLHLLLLIALAIFVVRLITGRRVT